MTARLKRAFLYASKWIGLFRLAPLVTRGGLQILCCHGFELRDGAQFQPNLFMKLSTFRCRLETINAHRVSVLPLQAALTCLQTGTLPPRATVITIDDGWYSFLLAAAELKQRGFPATLYATTYYSVKETPVFGLVVEYLFWRSRREFLDLGDLPLAQGGVVDLRDRTERERVMWQLIEYGERQDREEARETLGRELGKRLDVDYDQIRKSRCFSLLTRSELKQLTAFDIATCVIEDSNRVSCSTVSGVGTALLRNRDGFEAHFLR